MNFARKVLLTALAVAFVPGTAAADRLSEILEVIPSSSQAVLLAPDPAGSAAKIRDLAATFSPKTPPVLNGIGPGMLLRALGIKNAPDGIDPAGPAALAVPLPPHPVVIVTVADYERFIAGLVAGGGPEATLTREPDGTDALRLNGRAVTVRRSGGLALLAAQPFLLDPPAPGASLGVALSAEEVALLREGELFVRIGARGLADLAEPLLRSLVSASSRRPKRAPGADGGKGPNTASGPQTESLRRLLNVEIDLLVRGLRQTEAIDLALKIDAASAGLSVLLLPAAGSGFENIVAKLGPGNHDLLRLAPAEAMMAGSSTMSLATMLDVTQEILVAVAGALESPESREAVAGLGGLMRSWAEVVGPRSIWYAVNGSGAEPFVMFTANEVKDIAKARAIANQSFEMTRTLLADLAPGDSSLPEFSIQSAEYRGVPIESVKLQLPVPPRKAASAKGSPLPFEDGIVHVWLAYPAGLLVGCFYTADPAPMQRFLDRILDGRDGGLPADPGFALANRFIPADAMHIGYFSLSRVVENMARAFTRGDAEVPPLSGEAARAVLGFATYRTGGAVQTDLTVPLEGLEGLAEALRGMRPSRGSGSAPPAEEPANPRE